MVGNDFLGQEFVRVDDITSWAKCNLKSNGVISRADNIVRADGSILPTAE